MPDETAVKRELARLARCDPIPTGDREGIVRRAEAAAERVERAAAFAAAGGPARIERAVAAAERAGDDALARRGRRALAQFEAFRDACRPVDRGETGESVYRGETCGRVDRGETSESVDRGEASKPIDRGETCGPVDRGETSEPVDHES